MLTITKDKSLLIKGIVILMMVWLHLFNGNHTNLCECLFYVGGVPLVKWLSNACGPVNFFLLLSGYGLAFTYNKGKFCIKGQAKRLLKLYLHYWIVLGVFLIIGFFISAEQYPGGIRKFVANFVGWDYTYNGEMWFLFPYCMITMACPMIFRLIDKLGIIKILLLSAIIYVLICFLISRYGKLYLFNHLFLYRPILFLQFLYPFTVGAVFYLAGINMDRKLNPVCILLFIVALVAFVSAFGNSIVYMVYVPLLVWLLCQISYPKWIKYVLMELGRKSMVIWMVHTWLCYYLFQPQVYSLRYPLVIMGGVVLISYLIAIPVMWMAKKVLNVLRI